LSQSEKKALRNKIGARLFREKRKKFVDDLQELVEGQR
jgi:hypothetical protein